MAAKTELVGRGYVSALMRATYKRAPTPGEVIYMMEVLADMFPEYYSTSEKVRFGIRQRLWLREYAEIVVLTTARMRDKEHKTRAQRRDSALNRDQTVTDA